MKFVVGLTDSPGVVTGARYPWTVLLFSLFGTESVGLSFALVGRHGRRRFSPSAT